MGNDTTKFTANSQEETHFEDLPQVVMMGLMSTSDITADDIKSNIDRLFSELFESASKGTVLQAGLDALDDVRSTWTFIQRNTDELTRAGFYTQLIDRILHNASIYGLGQSRHRALAIRELVFNLNLAYNQDVPTPLNLRCFRRRLVSLLHQLDSNMQAIGMSCPHLHNLRQVERGHRFFDDIMADYASRYVNLCAFASDLTRENIEVLEWEDIMTITFDRAWNNMPPSRDNGGRQDIWKAYLSGAEAWVDHNVIQKSLRGRRVSQEAWRMWQDMFMEASGAMDYPGSGTPPNSFIQASREIKRALEHAHNHREARHTRRSYALWAPKGRPLRIPANV